MDNDSLDVEQSLKNGHLRCVVSSSSSRWVLVVLCKSVVLVQLLQHCKELVAGHQVGGLPRARFLPTSPQDLLELVALQNGILRGSMDLSS